MPKLRGFDDFAKLHCRTVCEVVSAAGKFDELPELKAKMEWREGGPAKRVREDLVHLLADMIAPVVMSNS